MTGLLESIFGNTFWSAAVKTVIAFALLVVNTLILV